MTTGLAVGDSVVGPEVLGAGVPNKSRTEQIYSFKNKLYACISGLYIEVLLYFY